MLWSEFKDLTPINPMGLLDHKDYEELLFTFLEPSLWANILDNVRRHCPLQVACLVVARSVEKFKGRDYRRQTHFLFDWKPKKDWW